VRNRAKAFALRTRAPKRGPRFAVDGHRTDRPPGLAPGPRPRPPGRAPGSTGHGPRHQVDGPGIAHQVARTRARSSASSHQVDGHQVDGPGITAHGPRIAGQVPATRAHQARSSAHGPGATIRPHQAHGRRPGDPGPGFRMPRDQGAGGRRKAQAARQHQGGRMRYGGSHYGQVTRHKKNRARGPGFRCKRRKAARVQRRPSSARVTSRSHRGPNRFRTWRSRCPLGSFTSRPESQAAARSARQVRPCLVMNAATACT
jgi:hypothetical protein